MTGPSRLLITFVPIVIGLLVLTTRARAQSYLFNRADFTIGTNPGGVAVGDFNRDGKLDAAVTDSVAQTLTMGPTLTFMETQTVSNLFRPVVRAP